MKRIKYLCVLGALLILVSGCSKDDQAKEDASADHGVFGLIGRAAYIVTGGSPKSISIGSDIITVGESTVDDLGLDEIPTGSGSVTTSLPDGNLAFTLDDNGTIVKAAFQTQECTGYKGIQAGQKMEDVYKALGSPTTIHDDRGEWVYSKTGKLLSEGLFLTAFTNAAQDKRNMEVYVITVGFDGKKSVGVGVEYMVYSFDS